MAALLRRLLPLACLLVTSLASAQSVPDCDSLTGFPASACRVNSDPVTAIVYSQEDAKRLAGGRKQQLLGRVVVLLERWSGTRLDAAQREQLLGALGRRLQLESTFVMTPDDSGQVYMLSGALAFEVRDAQALRGILEEVLGGTLPAAPPPASAAPPPSAPSATTPAAPTSERWQLALTLSDARGVAVRPQRLDFSPSRERLDAGSTLVFEAGDSFDREFTVASGSDALQAVLRLDGYYPAPEPGGYVVPRESLALRWERPSAGAVSRQAVRLVGQQPVIAALVNMAGLDEDQLDASADLVGLIEQRLAAGGHTHFLQLSGQGRRVEMRSQAFFPSAPQQLSDAARELLDESIVDAGPLLPQLSGGLVQCRAAEIAPCWVVYVAKRAFANRPSTELVERLRALPQAGERLLIVELLEDPGQRPLYAEASARHVAVTLPEAWLDDGPAALEPLAEKIVSALNAP